jgi:hypothetical protein
MKPATPLKLSAIAFAVLWTGWMIWSSGSFERVNAVILSIGGALVGYLWYRLMRWWFQRTGLLPHDENPPGSITDR